MKKELIYIISYTCFFFAPIIAVIVAVAILTLCDMWTGFYASKVSGSGYTKKKDRTISKIIFYSLAIFLCRIVELYLIKSVPWSAIVSGYIGVYEFRSNMRNISTITGNNIYQALINKIQAFKNKPL